MMTVEGTELRNPMWSSDPTWDEIKAWCVKNDIEIVLRTNEDSCSECSGYCEGCAGKGRE